MPRVAFTAKTRKYLGSLDAVESVTQYRICYSKEFRDDCMRRYAEGGSPAAISARPGLIRRSLDTSAWNVASLAGRRKMRKRPLKPLWKTVKIRESEFQISRYK